MLMLAVLAPPAAAAPGGDRRALEARVAELEAALQAVKAELDATKERDRPAPDPPAASAPPSPRLGTSPGPTTIKLSGFIKAETLVSDFSGGEGAGPVRDYYLPSAIPVGGAGARRLDAHAKQTRLALTVTTPIGADMLAGHIEADFQGAPGTQGSERTTNGYNPGLRRAVMSYAGWTAGQDWTTFQHVPALPETADFIGPTEGTVFVRQALVRHELQLTDALSLALSLENPETSSVTSSSPALVENDDDRLPDIAGRLVYRGTIGELSLSGIARELRVAAPPAAAQALGWGLSLAGKLPLGAARRDDVRFMLSAARASDVTSASILRPTSWRRPTRPAHRGSRPLTCSPALPRSGTGGRHACARPSWARSSASTRVPA
jgi:hypothetical protein